MLKEIIISIVIIVSIFALDLVTQNFTKESVEHTSTMLDDLKEEIKNNNNVANNIEEVYKNWEERRQTLAYFIEHDELEKVETNLTNINSFIEEDEQDMAISNIDEAKFILEHIKEKNAFNLENIF